MVIEALWERSDVSALMLSGSSAVLTKWRSDGVPSVLESQLLVRLERNPSEAVPRAGLAHLSVSEELSMNKSILVGLAILTFSTSAALAAQRTHHGRAMKPNASAAAISPNPYGRAMNANAFAGTGAAPVGWWGGVSSSDRAQYLKNLHDSGYDPKKNFNASGNLATQ